MISQDAPSPFIQTVINRYVHLGTYVTICIRPGLEAFARELIATARAEALHFGYSSAPSALAASEAHTGGQEAYGEVVPCNS